MNETRIEIGIKDLTTTEVHLMTEKIINSLNEKELKAIMKLNVMNMAASIEVPTDGV